MKRWRETPWRCWLAAALLVLSGAAAPAEAQERERFTLFMSPEEEARIGREQHPKVLAQFGGAYEDPELARYVDSLGQFLASASSRPDIEYTFTILDSPIVNAFALPGGYVYVSRGLLALADNEAELAGVLAHEIGHVTARHAAERYSQSVVANLGLAILGALGGSELVQGLGVLGAEIVLKSYSRDQELEADTLGVTYMSRAGFDPHAMSSFLRSLRAHDELQARVTGRPGGGDQLSLLSTHPRTVDRIEQAIGAAGGVAVREPMLAADIYLGKIDGVLYGDNPDQGLIRGTTFVHPELGFRFDVPEGFELLNSQTQVLALGPENARILFSGARRQSGLSTTRYLTDVWAREIPLGNVERITVDGLDAATGQARVSTRAGPMDLRLVVIGFDPATVYRFAFMTPPALTDRLALPFRRTTYSFRRLAPGEAGQYRPYRIRVVRAQPGDTTESLARTQPFARLSVERVRVLNDLGPGEPLRPGRLVKLVSE